LKAFWTEIVSAVLHSLSEPIWEKPTTQVLGGAAKTDTVQIIMIAGNNTRTLFQFFIGNPP
jgi:hypothetical protein